MLPLQEAASKNRLCPLARICQAPQAEAKALVGPMQKLHALRTVVRGHATPEKKNAESEARTVFRSLRAHFTQVVTDCEKILNQVPQSLEVEVPR